MLSALLFLSICPLQHAESDIKGQEINPLQSAAGQFPKNRKLIFTGSTELVKFSFKLKGQPLKTIEDIYPESWPRSYEEFDGASDWLKDLTFSFTNITGRTMTYAVLNLTFPEASKNGREAVHQIFIGIGPDPVFARPELRLLTSGAVEISLSEKYGDIKTLVETVGNVPVESVTQMSVQLHAALFDDGTRYEAGNFFRRNPDPNGRRWIPIARIFQ